LAHVGAEFKLSAINSPPSAIPETLAEIIKNNIGRE